MKRKICVATGSRAEYGLLRLVMDGIRNSPALELQVAATGAHLSPRFGSTLSEIEGDGFALDAKVDIELDADTPSGIARSMGLGLAGFGAAFERLNPDLLLVAGDRFEIFSAVAAALVAGIPVGHIHGGETTEGAFDEALRHSITKMSHLHFVAADEYRRRVIQLGEDPDRVFLVGGLGVDAIKRTKLLGREELESGLGMRLGSKSALVTFHPVTLEKSGSAAQMGELLAALDRFPDVGLVFTMPNADTDGRALYQLIEKYASGRPNARAFDSLGQLRYLSCLKEASVVVGNSSSALAEAPSFGTPAVNIGDRQKGRLKSASVVDCDPDRDSIATAIQRALSSEFAKSAMAAKNPYGEGGASDRILAVLEQVPLDGILKKSFYDLPPQ